MKNPFSKTNNKSTLPLQIIHTDIIGQFKLMPSFNGYKYYITFISNVE